MSFLEINKRNWTKEEIEYLHEKWGELSIAKISRKLSRSINAVKIKALREGLTNFLWHIDGITLGQLAVAFNVSYCWTIKKIWIERLNIPYRTKVTAEKKAYRYICLDDFWKWAEENRHGINFACLEKNILGKEPEWVGEKRSADQQNTTYNKVNEPWTREEERILKGMLIQYRHTYKDIARKLGRTEGAIKLRIKKHDLMHRPIPSIQRKWTDIEIETLIRMKLKGYGNNSVADKIGKTTRAVEGKLERLMKEEKYRNKLKIIERKGRPQFDENDGCSEA